MHRSKHSTMELLPIGWNGIYKLTIQMNEDWSFSGSKVMLNGNLDTQVKLPQNGSITLCIMSDVSQSSLSIINYLKHLF